MILEVSRKQDYIFASKKLRENAQRSAQISYVTSSAFFRRAAGERYLEEKNLVYAGGGHTVLQFDGPDQARDFARQVTGAAMEEFRGLELFVKQMPYDSARTPGDNLKELSRRLEEKKALRRGSFRYTALGVEELDPETFRPRGFKRELPHAAPDVLEPPEGYQFPREFSELAGADNFIAVVHIDGNAMGKRVDGTGPPETTGRRAAKSCAGSAPASSGILRRPFSRRLRSSSARGTVGTMCCPSAR